MIDQMIILQTKLMRPKIPNTIVKRPRLYIKLMSGLAKKVSIISAPAGFGKSTLLSEWTHSLDIPVSWLSLDKGDNDLVRFWTYVVATLTEVTPSLGKRAQSILHSVSIQTVDNMVTLLLNDILELQDHFLLVLDDYHMIEDIRIHQSLNYFIQNLPINGHIYIASRTVLPLSLERYREKGEIVELTIEDMRFIRDEIQDFWGELSGEIPSQNLLQLLENRTEGWVAGLQLAAITSHGRGNTINTLENFTGSHRFVVEYLLEEVFLGLSEPLQEFLMQTSILERFNDSLCSQITGQSIDSHFILQLEQANLLIIPLDKERNWYRYHHLFADFLRDRLTNQYGSDIRQLHLKSSEWFEQHSLFHEAIHHALEAEDFERSIMLITKCTPELFRRNQSLTLINWIKRLPESYTKTMDVLIILAWSEVVVGELKIVERRLVELKQTLEHITPTLPSDLIEKYTEEIFLITYWYLTKKGDFEVSLQVLQSLVERDDIDQIVNMDLYTNYGIEFNDCDLFLLRSSWGYGSMVNAIKYHAVCTEFVKKSKVKDYHYTAYYHVCMGEIEYERNNLKNSQDFAQEGMRVSLLTANLGALAPAFALQARIHAARGNYREAIAVLTNAQDELKKLDGEHWLDPIKALLVRYSIFLNQQEEVDQWLAKSNLHSERGITVFQEFEFLSLMKVLHYKQRLDEAFQLSVKISQKADQEKRIPSKIEALIYQSIYFYQKQLLHNSMETLHAALQLGESNGYFRIFIDEGLLLIEVLMKYHEVRLNHHILSLQNGVSLKYLKRLLADVGELSLPTVAKQDNTLTDLLTDREAEVLKYISLGLSNREVADQLVMAIGTVKIHLNRIYGKLGVSNRVQAIQKARQLNLIPD
ncbi:LuxR C-terminal-related transcriptional regulator [Brevibacillus sp. SYSU BS000544]|uniref:LuxR C-terminal-related transcriptional regulator n=1 Tax=Brevibacillus sp. SYSU BS000544 TaxID=3416443 RepID=UPI003CE57AAB